MLDEYSEDNLRRIRRDLHSGDVIEAVCTVTRIVGVDSSRKLSYQLIRFCLRFSYSCKRDY